MCGIKLYLVHLLLQAAWFSKVTLNFISDCSGHVRVYVSFFFFFPPNSDELKILM